MTKPNLDAALAWAIDAMFVHAVVPDEELPIVIDDETREKVRAVDNSDAQLNAAEAIEAMYAVVTAAKRWAKFGRDDADDEHELLQAVYKLRGIE